MTLFIPRSPLPFSYYQLKLQAYYQLQITGSSDLILLTLLVVSWLLSHLSADFLRVVLTWAGVQN